MASSLKVNFVLLIAFFVSNYWTFGNAASTVQKRSYYGNTFNGFPDVPDAVDNSGEVEVVESEGEMCPVPASAREFRRISNEIYSRVHSSVGCQPRPEIVKLPNEDPRADLVPDVAEVNRCHGFCYGGESSNCQAVPQSIKLRKVTVMKILRHQEPHCEVLHELEVEEHEECQCERVYFLF